MSLFNQRFKELKTEKNIMLKDLASDLGYSSSKLSYYLNGNNEPSYDELIKISNYFGVSIEYMLGVSPYRTKEQEYSTRKQELENSTINDTVYDLVVKMQYVLDELYIYENEHAQYHAYSRMLLLYKVLNQYLEFCEYASLNTSERYTEMIDYGYEISALLKEFYFDFIDDLNFEFEKIYSDPNTSNELKKRMARKSSFLVVPSSPEIKKRVNNVISKFNNV